MHQNISDSVVDWREERLKIKFGRRAGIGNILSISSMHYGGDGE